MKVTNIKRINKDDFDKDSRELVDRLSFALNPFLEQVVNVLNKNIDFDNLNQEIINLETQVNSSGIPTINFEIKNPLKTRIKGIYCINAENLIDNTLLTGAPFLTFTLESGVIRITQITGLPSNKMFRLSIILIG